MLDRSYPPAPEGHFDNRRQNFGVYGGYVLYYLCDPAFNRPAVVSLHEDDLNALTDLEQIEHKATALFEPLAVADNYDTYSLVERFGEQWHTFQTALPFDTPERQWLTDHLTSPHLTTPRRTSFKDITAEEWAEAIASQEATIVSAGIHRAVSGRTLLHRWLTWRRELGDYQDQGTLDIARDALHNLITIVSPETTIPASYTALGRSSVPTPEA